MLSDVKQSGGVSRWITCVLLHLHAVILWQDIVKAGTLAPPDRHVCCAVYPSHKPEE